MHIKKQTNMLQQAIQSNSAVRASVTKTPFGKEFKVERLEIDYTVGDTVSHVKFGKGVVTNLISGGKDYEVTVDFESAGTKRMFASFAKLKKLS